MKSEQWEIVVDVLVDAVAERDSRIADLTATLQREMATRSQYEVYLNNAASMARSAFPDIDPTESPYEKIRLAFKRLSDFQEVS